MPRTIPLPLAQHLAGDVLTLAVCVRVARRDGLIQGLTGHDEPLYFGGVLYQPTSGMEASSLRAATGTGVDNMELTGLLAGGALTLAVNEDDLLAERYDMADVTVFVVNWASPNDGAITLVRGRIGEIIVQQGAYQCEVRSLAQRLQQQIGDVTTPTCRVRDFGDAQCNPPGGVAAYQRTGNITTVVSRRAFTVGVSGLPSADYFTYGKAEILTGPNAGILREIKTGNNGTIVLQEPLPFAPVAGDMVRLTAGCNRLVETCRARFSNVANFRGEPHLPGQDTLSERGQGN